LKLTPIKIVEILAGVVGVAALVVLAVTLSFGFGDKICGGVTISGVCVEGMTKTEASSAIQAWWEKRKDRTITLTALDSKWQGTLGDFGASPDTRGAVKRAFEVGRSGGIINRAICVLTSFGNGKHIIANILTDERSVKRIVRKVAGEVDRPYRDAKLLVAESQLQIKPESCGIKIARQAAYSTISDALERGLSVIPLSVEVDKPKVTADDARSIDTLLASYTTYFNRGKVDRTHNLTLAAGSINGYVVKPGAVFSANAAIGPREASRGYRNAIIFVRGKLEEGLGGGTCQVSSTLYNSVLLAGLKIVERNHHSRPVPYVPPGRDATVAYGLLDFSFRNTNPQSIAIITSITGSRLTINIYGAATDKKKVAILMSRGARIAAGSKTIIDDTLPPGARKIVQPSSDGISVTVTRRLTTSDGTVQTEVISRDRYGVQNAVIAVGSGTAAKQAPKTSL